MLTLTCVGLSYDISNVSGHIFSTDGAIYYRAPQGQLGGFVSMGSSDNHGGHVTPYGALGDVYFNDQFSAGFVGGGFTSKTSGGLVEGHLVGYAMPNLSLKGFYTYITGHDGTINTAGAIAEWQISDTAPFSFFAGYSNLRIAGGGLSSTFSIFSIGAKIYLNGSGPLVNLQRSGNVDFTTVNTPLRFLF